MYTKNDCDNLLEKIANMEMGMPQQPPGMQPGSGGLVPEEQDPNAAAGGPAGPKGPPKVKPEQLYERMLKMTGRMADMSSQLGQSGQQSQSMEQMVREDQREMQAQNSGIEMNPMMGGQPQPQPGMNPMMGQPGLQPQASLKDSIEAMLRKEAYLQKEALSALGTQFVGTIAGPAVQALGKIKTRFKGWMKSNPLTKATRKVIDNRKLHTFDSPIVGGNLQGSRKI